MLTSHPFGSVFTLVTYAINDSLRSMIFLPELLKAYRSAARLHAIAQEHSPEVLSKVPLKRRLDLQYRLCGSQDDGANKRAVEFDGSESDYMDLSGEYSTLDTIIPAQLQALGRIEFKGVHFAYPARSTAKVLDNFSLSVNPGESVAIVGESGSGKSSCVGLLEKFYDFQSGRITLDGFDLRMLDSQWVRSQIRLVSQDTTLLSYTIADNIRYGDNDNRHLSLQQVQEAAQAASIHDFVMSLPLNYDTELSSSSLGPLSGGQRQRIAIARALVQRSAPILILDEATSALDNCSEAAVQEAILKASRGRTTIIVAHRLATVKHADKIVVMKDGRVVESGRHEELVQQTDGYYRKLWLKQQSAVCQNDD